MSSRDKDEYQYRRVRISAPQTEHETAELETLAYMGFKPVNQVEGGVIMRRNLDARKEQEPPYQVATPKSVFKCLRWHLTVWFSLVVLSGVSALILMTGKFKKVELFDPWEWSATLPTVGIPLALLTVLMIMAVIRHSKGLKASYLHVSPEYLWCGLRDDSFSFANFVAMLKLKPLMLHWYFDWVDVHRWYSKTSISEKVEKRAFAKPKVTVESIDNLIVFDGIDGQEFFPIGEFKEPLNVIVRDIKRAAPISAFKFSDPTKDPALPPLVSELIDTSKMADSAT